MFAAQARFPARSVAIAGVSNTFVRVGERRTTFHFCPTCGATVYYVSDEELIAIPVGAFADPTFPQPMISLHEERKHAWVEIPAGIERMD